ncbi:MAG TPA: DUF3999 domain-containing protein, partial [Myxococcota bacterium]|nr:DUF3999 domain-containing protein [Myxococcota bacterium]
EAVPLAFAPPSPPARETVRAVELPRFLVTTPAAAETGGDEVRIHTRDGTLVELRGARRARTLRTRPVAVLLDASALKEPVAALVFDWSSQPGTQVVQVRAEASDDLRAWSLVASGPLVKIVHGSRLLEQPRLEFAPRSARYYRITWDAPQFEIDGVRAEPPPRSAPVPRQVRRATARATAKEGEHEYDLGAALPVAALRLDLSDPNSVVAATFLARNDPDGSWVPVASSGFYRLARDGGELVSPALEVPTYRARYWLMRLAPGSSTAAPPQLEAHWRPAEVVFAARGEGPFLLAFGHREARAATLPLASLMPGEDREAVRRLPEARVGTVQAGPEPSRWQRMFAEADRKRIALWAVLLLGVAVLGGLAWRLAHRP